MSDHFSLRKNNPLVSVIIPTFNRADLLIDSLVSIDNQTYPNIEVIIVDDGSSDNTEESVNSFVSKKTVVKYYKQKNQGACAARNLGFLKSSGEYIQYLDSDDILDDKKIEDQVNYLEQNSNIDGVWGDWYKGSPHANVFIRSYAKNNLIEQFLAEHCIVNFAFLMRRSLIEKIGGWDINIKRNQEIDFHCRGLLKGAHYAYIPGNTGLWRTHENDRISQKRDVSKLSNFFKKWEEELEPKKLFTPAIKLFFSNFYFYLSTGDSKNSLSEKMEGLLNAVRLNPAISFINTRKMKILRKLFGKRIAVRLWLLKANNQ